MNGDLRVHPNLCPALRWKAQFAVAEPDPTAQQGDHSYWCMYTQTCIGPDGITAAPESCASPLRVCRGTGKTECG